ncbi:hypothetical protein MJD09_23785, partial [bacterium]|nr:hypothetical protein [bacterium]
AERDTITVLRRKAEELAGRLMTRVVLTITRDGRIETLENPKSKGKQYYKMSRQLLKEAENKLQARYRLDESPLSN